MDTIDTVLPFRYRQTRKVVARKGVIDQNRLLLGRCRVPAKGLTPEISASDRNAAAHWRTPQATEGSRECVKSSAQLSCLDLPAVARGRLYPEVSYGYPVQLTV